MAASVQALAIRISKLGVDGAPAVGSDTSFVSKQFTKFGFTPEYEDGEEIQTKAADGSICVYYKAPDVLKKVTWSLDICEPDPVLYEMLAGGSVLETTEATPTVVGWAAPELGSIVNTLGLAIEVWTRAIVAGKPAGTLPYIHWVLPFGTSKMDGERAMENGAMANGFVGEAQGNPAFATGPAGDWDYSSSAGIQFARVASYPTTQGFITVA